MTAAGSGTDRGAAGLMNAAYDFLKARDWTKPKITKGERWCDARMVDRPEPIRIGRRVLVAGATPIKRQNEALHEV